MQSEAPTSGMFVPCYNEGSDGDGYAKHVGWYLQCHDTVDEFGRPWVWTLDNGGDLWFQTREDAIRAACALFEAGITTDDHADQMSDDELREICYGALAW